MSDTRPEGPGEREAREAEDDVDPLPPGRRVFLERLTVALGAACAAALVVPVTGVLLAPLRRRPPDPWRRVGALGGFAVGETTKVTFLDPAPLPWAGFAAETAAWIRRTGEEELIALGAHCTHVGCPVSWMGTAKLFMCPCHGGAYYEDGKVAAGPPPRPLPRHEVRVRDGQVEILPMPVQAALGRRFR